jgi:hypothetical protein
MKFLKFDKSFARGICVGVVVTLLLSSTVAFAASRKQIDAFYNDIKLLVDGKAVTPRDAAGKAVEPFLVDGTTYLPLRAVASALGKKVNWNQDTYTVSIADVDNAPLSDIVGIRELEPVSISNSMDDFAKMANIDFETFPNLKDLPTSRKDGVLMQKQEYTSTNSILIDPTFLKYIQSYDACPNLYRSCDAQRTVYEDAAYDAIIEYALNKNYERLTGKVGVDDSSGVTATGNLLIYVDGKLKYTSPELTRDSKPIDVDLDLIGAANMKIIFKCAGGKMENGNFTEPNAKTSLDFVDVNLKRIKQ